MKFGNNSKNKETKIEKLSFLFDDLLQKYIFFYI